MLASPTSNIQSRHRQHRRQNSTPVSLEAAKVPNLPAAAMQRYAMHRRGMSLDQRATNLQSSPLSQGPGESISNVGVCQQQHLTREGPSYFDLPNVSSLSAEYQSFGQDGLGGFTNPSSSENIPNNACVGPDAFSAENQDPRNQHLKGSFGHIQQQQQQQLGNASMTYASGLNHQYVNDGTWNSCLVDNSGLPQEFDKSVSGGIRRMSVQSDLSQHSQRPSTPINQINSNYFPITPATTPFRQTSEFAPYGQNVNGSPTKNLPTPQSAFMQRAKSLQGVPGSTFTEPKVDVPSPPDTAPINFEPFDKLNSQESDFECSKFQTVTQSESFNTSLKREEQHHSRPSSASVSFQSSPELAFMPLPGEKAGKNPKVPIVPATPSRASPKKPANSALSSTKPKLSPRPASIDSLNLDSRIKASITETGITIEEIASYISGPDEDGKWICLHPGCDRRFGRKENIKSHIQTHLGDRQYKCNHCDKCFVRGHDLKRHAKIHTGDKPYECLCGNVFARHDALTRHRQRGMCIGGYQGVVRKTTKRGRPKKNRPDMEERQDKAARTREKVAAKAAAASVSGSESSCGSPLTEGLENMSIRGSSPTEDVAIFAPNNYCMPSDVFTFTPPASPGYSTGNKPSPAVSHRPYTPSTDDGNLSRSPSKQGLEHIPSGLPNLPPISEAAEGVDPEAAMNSTANNLSSPLTVPGLTGSIDFFISQNEASSFDKDRLSSFDESELPSFPDFATGSTFGDLGLFQEKSPLNEEFLVEYNHNPSDVFFQ